MVKKTFIYLLLLLCLFGSINATDINLYSCTSSSCKFDYGGGTYDLYFYYSTNNALYYWTTNTYYELNSKKYSISGDSITPETSGNHLSGPSCSINSITGSSVTTNLKQPFIVAPDTFSYNLIGIPQSLLNNYYYMNTKIEYVLYRSGGQIAVSSYTNVLVPPGGTTYSLTNPFTQSYVETNYGPGSYEVKARATPIDGKCPSAISGESIAISSFTIAAQVQLAPVASLSASTLSIYQGQGVTLNWGSENANSCNLYLNAVQLTSGLTGIYETGPLDSSKRYTLTCTNGQGISDTKEVTITVNPLTYSWSPSSTSACIPTSACTSETNLVPCSYTTYYNCVDSLNNVVSNSMCSGSSYSIGTSTSICDDDLDNVENGYDLCDDKKWDIAGHTATTKEQYQGCPYEYSAICTGGANYDGTYFHCNYNNGICTDSIQFNSILSLDASNTIQESVNTIIPSKGNGYYLCQDKSGFFCGNKDLSGYCDLRLNANPNVYCTITGKKDLLKVGESKKYYKYKKILKREKEDDLAGRLTSYSISYNTPSCAVGGTVFPSIPIEYSYDNSYELSGPEYDNLIRDPLTGELKINDTITVGKLACDSTNDLCSLKVNSTSTVNVNLATIPQPRTAEIKIVKEGINVRNDTVDISLIAMEAHKIQKFTNSTEAQSFIAKSYDVMTKFNITKDLIYNALNNRTAVKIKMNNITGSDRQNLTLYMLLDKNIAGSLSDISSINQGNGQFFVVDKDPIIGWYFNESGSDEEVGYTVPGNNEGGTIIITQTPILYNEGELIINYRETACTAGEIELFELDDLLNSKIYNTGSGKLYKVCITHLNSSVNLALGAGVNSIDVMSYTNNSNGSSNPYELASKITLSVPNSDLYWDVKVQKENPSGNYSCIGSFNLVNQSSLFGDCGYNEDARIWIHLGNDMNSPTTTLSYPALAHTLKVTLTAFEPTWESGVKSLSYRIVEDSASFTTELSKTATFMVTCPNDWNCKKTIQFYAEDNEGNIADVESKDLLLIDKGSACQSDCTAKPSPNRYLKECRNLNGCSFYNYNNLSIFDGGEYVANKCDYLSIGSWTSYNDTHEILCPKGPFRESKFTSQRLNAIDESNCQHIIKTPYPVIYDGENIIMNVVSCINFEE